VTRQDVAELCQIRRVLESEASRSACGRIDVNELTSLAAELKRLIESGSAQGTPGFDGAAFVQDTRSADSRLHDLIAHACGSRRLAEEIGRFKLLFRAFRDVGYTKFEERNDYRRMTEENDEHLAIVAALAEGDSKRAAKAMGRHIDESVRYWGQLIVDALTAVKRPRDG